MSGQTEKLQQQVEDLKGMIGELPPEGKCAMPLVKQVDGDKAMRRGAVIAEQRERIEALERENARLLASLLAATGSAHADFPALALDWDNTGEARKREWCQWLYEHAAKQDGRIVALEARNGELESLVLDTYAYYWAAYYSGVGKEDIDKRNLDEIERRMAELGIETEGGCDGDA